MNIVLVGPPASGKGTQAKLLAEKFDLVHISTGDLLRNVATQKSELALQIKALIDNGNFVSDELITELLRQHLNSIDQKNGVLLDGYPRTVAQAKELNKFFKIDFVFEFYLSEQTLVNRIIDRFYCPKCKKNYAMSDYNKEFCSECGEKLVQRADDTAEIASLRYQDYISKTFPILEFYKNVKGFHKLDAEKPVMEVFDKLCEIIKSEL